jgi:hypothetical protein
MAIRVGSTVIDCADVVLMPAPTATAAVVPASAR